MQMVSAHLPWYSLAISVHHNACFIMSQSDVVCQSEVIILDLDMGSVLIVNSTFVYSKLITFPATYLSENHLYNTTVVATNINASTTSFIEISKTTNDFYFLEYIDQVHMTW